MGSRIRKTSYRVFDALFMLEHSNNLENISYENDVKIIKKYPLTFNDEEIIKSVPQFSYPYPCQISTVLHYSFVLTSIDSKWTFGYCRHASQPSTKYLCLLSSLPWHDTFYKLLNYIYSILTTYDEFHLNQFLDALYNVQMPEPGLQLQVIYYINAKEYEFTAQCPDHHKIPSIPEDRNLTELFNALDTYNMIVIFASLLNERRILITSSKLSRLSACVQAANSLIYPMHWQHIFIPVLPISLLDYLSAPMPFLIGVPSANMKRVKFSELGDIVLVDADENKVETPFNDVDALPTDIVNYLRKNLRSSNNLLGDAVARTFLRGLVQLIGGYRDALRFNEVIKFDDEQFVLSRSVSFQPFLRKMLHLQIFQQFIEGRLQTLTDGEGFNDEFEFELNMYEDKASTRIRSQYKDWLSTMKKESGALFKSMNPAMKSAYKQVKDKGKQVKDKSKQAYKGIKTRIHDNLKSNDNHSHNYVQQQNNFFNGEYYGANVGLNQTEKAFPPSPFDDTASIKSSNSSKGKSSFTFHIGKESIKKSLSGVALAISERNSSSKAATAIKNGNKSGNKLFKNGSSSLINTQENQFEKAPEASSEDSDIDSDEKCEEENELDYKPINLDLMGDLEEILQKQQQQSFSNNSINYLNNGSSNSIASNISEKSFNDHFMKSNQLNNNHKSNNISNNCLSLTAPPRVNKRRTVTNAENKIFKLQNSLSSQSSLSSSASSTNSPSTNNNLLIQLESSPEEDVTVLFDPLLKLNENQSMKSNGKLKREDILLDFNSTPLTLSSQSSSDLLRTNEPLENRKRYGIANESALFDGNQMILLSLKEKNNLNPFEEQFNSNDEIFNETNNNSNKIVSNNNIVSNNIAKFNALSERNWQKFD